MSAATIAIDRPACAVCAAWQYPCAACRREIMAWLRGPAIPLGERLSVESRAAVGQ